MPNMALGGYNFLENPSEIDDIVASVNYSAHAKSYSSVQRFNWGATVKGKTIVLSWDYMPASQYDALHALWVAGDAVTFNPQLTNGKTYTVTIENLKGRYHMTQGDTYEDASAADRTACELILLVIAEI